MAINTILMRREIVLKRLHLGIALTCSCTLLVGCIPVSQRKTVEKNIKYQKQEDCFLCSDEDRSLFSLYDEGIGVLNLNRLEIYPLLSDDDSGSGSTINTNGKNKTVVEIDRNNARRITNVTFRLKEDSKPDAAEMGEIMCEDCVNSILENNTYDMSFVDLSTREIIPLEDNMVQFFVGDYAVHKVSGTDEEQGKTLEYLVFFAPEIE